MTNPKNIVLWSPPRTGSTSLISGMHRGLASVHGPTVRGLWEGTGKYGILLPDDARAVTKNNIDLGNHDGNPLSLEYLHWFINRRGMLTKHKPLTGIVGDPRDEPPNRAQLIREGKWNNSVIFKNMRWSDESKNRVQLNQLFDAAILSSAADFHHVILWRRDLFKWFCSTFLFARLSKAHGEIEWDGKQYGLPQSFNSAHFKWHKDRLLTECIDSFKQLPKENTLMIETQSINNISTLTWPDGAVLEIPNQSTVPRGKVVYINTQTNQAVDPIDIVHPYAIEKFHNMEIEFNKKFDWQNLDKNLGFTCQSN
jgi:hypothetical protein